MTPALAFVTGGTGFIGRLLVEELSRRGWAVRVLARDEGKFRQFFSLLDNVECQKGDVLDPSALVTGLRGASLAFHLAGVTKAVRAADFDRGNHQSCRVLAEAVQSAGGGLERLLHVSSLAAAGPSPTPDPPEDFDPPRPVSRYGWSKLRGEEELRPLDGLVTVFRPPAVFGPADTDVFRFFQTVRRAFIPVPGFDGKRISLVWAPDLVRAMADAALAPACAGRTYYPCFADPVSWAELGALVAQAFGVRRRAVRLPNVLLALAGAWAGALATVTRRPGILSLDKYREGRERWWVCSSRGAERDFGFRPAAGLAGAVRATANWYCEKGWLRRGKSSR